MMTYSHKFKFQNSLKILLLSKQAKWNCSHSELTSPKCPGSFKGVQRNPKGWWVLGFFHQVSPEAEFDLAVLISNCLKVIHSVTYLWKCFTFLSLKKTICKTKLQIAQNKCIRFCLELPSHSHVNPSHFRKINCLPVECREKYVKYCKGIAPSYLNDMFISLLNNCNTRSQIRFFHTLFKKEILSKLQEWVILLIFFYYYYYFFL